MIYVDWGSTNARAWLVDDAGKVVDRREGTLGIRNIKSRAYRDALHVLTGAWRASKPAVPILMSGMIGSSQGWFNTNYCMAPTGLRDLAASIAGVPDENNVSIVPGVAVNVAEHQDVMRGEEVQVFGALHANQLTSAVLCLPGTHSKWVRVENARITGFHTSMTGEIYDVLLRHSLLGAEISAAGVSEDGAFDEGLRMAQVSGALLSDLFSVRARTLLSRMERESSPSYLSGILIGAEIKEMLRLYRASRPILLVANKPLSTIYQRALTRFGAEFTLKDAELATLNGLIALQSLRAHGPLARG